MNHNEEISNINEVVKKIKAEIVTEKREIAILSMDADGNVINVEPLEEIESSFEIVKKLGNVENENDQYNQELKELNELKNTLIELEKELEVSN